MLPLPSINPLADGDGKTSLRFAMTKVWEVGALLWVLGSLLRVRAGTGACPYAVFRCGGGFETRPYGGAGERAEQTSGQDDARAPEPLYLPLVGQSGSSRCVETYAFKRIPGRALFRHASAANSFFR
jgi:hypothetical protein